MKNDKNTKTNLTSEFTFFEAAALLRECDKKLEWLKKPGNDYASESRIRFWANIGAKFHTYVVNHPEYQDWDSDTKRELKRLTKRQG